MKVFGPLDYKAMCESSKNIIKTSRVREKSLLHNRNSTGG